MKGDVINRFRPIGQTRDAIVRDGDRLYEVLKAWIDTTNDLMFEAITEWDREIDAPRVELPAGYEELTYLIAWWCDTSRYSIDPTPITECFRLIRKVSRESLVQNGSNSRRAFDDFIAVFDLIVPLCNRIVMASITNETDEEVAGKIRGMTSKVPTGWIGPKSPQEWCNVFDIALSTFARWRKPGNKLRSHSDTEKAVWIHPDDVAQHKKK